MAPALYAIATLMKSEHDNCPVTGHDLIFDIAKDSYCRKRSIYSAISGIGILIRENGTLICTASVERAGKIIHTAEQPGLLYYSQYPTISGERGQ